MSIRDEVRARTVDLPETEIPVPGFPSGKEFVAWCQEQPRQEIVDAMVEMLNEGSWPGMYIAMFVLRHLGVEIFGQRRGGGFVKPDEPDDPRDFVWCVGDLG